jgi:hypothetical protein
MLGEYLPGTKVRIRSPEWFRRTYSDIWQYENLTGEIKGSTLLAAWLRPWAAAPEEPPRFVRAYNVQLDLGLTADFVREDCIEVVESPRNCHAESAIGNQNGN